MFTNNLEKTDLAQDKLKWSILMMKISKKSSFTIARKLRMDGKN